jgi:hypothetical protein
VLIPAGHRFVQSISGQESGYRSETDMFNHALEPPRMAQRVGYLRRSAHHSLRIVKPYWSPGGCLA